eukprot:1766316-Rhodomonas_salina.1
MRVSTTSRAGPEVCVYVAGLQGAVRTAVRAGGGRDRVPRAEQRLAAARARAGHALGHGGQGQDLRGQRDPCGPARGLWLPHRLHSRRRLAVPARGDGWRGPARGGGGGGRGGGRVRRAALAGHARGQGVRARSARGAGAAARGRVRQARAPRQS